MENLQPISDSLIEPLSEIFQSETFQGSPVTLLQQTVAADYLAVYAAEHVTELVNLTAKAKPEQFPKLLRVLESHGDVGVRELQIALTDNQANAELIAPRKANLAVALLSLDRDANIWPMLRHSPDPTLRSYLIHGFKRLSCDPSTLLHRLLKEQDDPIRRALILSLGEYDAQDLATEDRELIVRSVEAWYRQDTDPGVHGAAGWLLRRWLGHGHVTKLDAALQQNQMANRQPADDRPWWHVNGQGQTMIVVPGPVSFEMGSPESEPGRDSDEALHTVQIPRTFAVSTHEVTVGQYQRFLPRKSRT